MHFFDRSIESGKYIFDLGSGSAVDLVIPASVASIGLQTMPAGVLALGGSVNFGSDNTGRYFRTGSLAGMPLSGDFTIVGVIKADRTISNRHKYFFSTGASGDAGGLNLYVQSGAGSISFIAGTASGVSTASGVPDEYCLVYGRRIGGQVTAGFINLATKQHIKSTSVASAASFANDVVTIGGRADLESQRFYTGFMAWIGLLNVGLSDADLESIANQEFGALNQYRSNTLELWDMRYRPNSQPGVVNGLDAQRFGSGYGAGGEFPLPYELPESLVIEANPAIFGLAGVKATIDARGQLIIGANVANIGLSGVPASVEISGVLTIRTAEANIGLSGVNANIVINGALTIVASPAIFDLTGVNAGIKSDGNLAISAKAATIGLEGLYASINGNVRVSTIPAVFGLSGVPSKIEGIGKLTVRTKSATFALTGVKARIKIGYEPDMRIEQKIWLALKSRIETL